MSTFDLKPIPAQTIEKLGLEQSDLWQIKLGEEVFGPYETLSLKHYALENSALMEETFISKCEQQEWHPFFSLSEFADSHSEVQKDKTHFWIMENGQKSRPLSQEEVNREIDRGALSWNEEVSINDGQSWVKVGQCPKLAAKFTSSTQLPPPPLESSFTRAKGQVMSDLEDKSHQPPSVEDAVPSLAYIAHMQESKNQIKLEELTLSQNNEVIVSDSFKWAMPVAGTAVIMIGLIGFHFSTQKANDPLESYTEVAPEAKTQDAPQPQTVARNANRPQRANSVQRDIASFAQRSSLTQPPIFRDDTPTHIETHSDDVGPDLRERESAENMTEGEPRVADEKENEEPSLVDSPAPKEDESLEAAMNNISQAPPANDPVIIDRSQGEESQDKSNAETNPEEAADF